VLSVAARKRVVLGQIEASKQTEELERKLCT
jgi:hypothetical protein